MKLLGYLINIIAVTTLTCRLPPITISVTLVFLVCYVLRVHFEMEDEETQIFMETMYVCGFSVSLANVISLYTQGLPVYCGIIVTIFLVGLNFCLRGYFLKWKVSKNLPDLEDLYKEGSFASTVHRLTRYLCGHVFKAEEGHALREFLNRNSGCKLPLLGSETRIEYLKALYKLAV